jgi:lipopolysaccharide assembly outer membrane protein LptD (OstA)
MLVFAAAVLLVPVCLPLTARADAYLSEDDIRYSADTYRINYQDKIIRALGNAQFTRGMLRIDAETIVIHYAEDQKRAELSGRVTIRHSGEGITVTGSSGEVRYLQQYARVSGGAQFTDGERTIRSRVIETWNWETHRFSEQVEYRDGRVQIDSGALQVEPAGPEESGSEDTRARFERVSRVVFVESGDRLFCSTIVYYQSSGVAEFSGEVLFRRNQSEETGRPLVLQAQVVRFHPETDLLMCIGDVYALSGRYTVRAPVARYFRESETIRADGGVTARRSSAVLEGASLLIDLATGRIELQDSVQGEFRQAEQVSGGDS